MTAALAITEPGAGSDLRAIGTTAVREGDGWVLNGSKTFITNGADADILVVVARTSPDPGFEAFSLFLLEAGAPGFTTGRPLDKLGQRAESVAELSFTDVRLPAESMLGDEGKGLAYLNLRLGDLDEAKLMLGELRRLDPTDHLGGGLLSHVLARHEAGQTTSLVDTPVDYPVRGWAPQGK